MSALRVVTLPPELDLEDAKAFAARAARRGAQLLELRSDLSSDDTGALPRALAPLLPLIVSERGRVLPASWVAQARFVDRDIHAPLEEGTTLPSHHAPGPLEPRDALALWKAARVAAGAWIKHVEPMTNVADGARLLETQRVLSAEFGVERVTVLAMGPWALPFRCVLAARNALDYLALEPSFRAAPGQRLLDDAVRSARGPADRGRLGILGTGIDGSRSPRIHQQPFDRIELPADAPVSELLAALRPHYRGFAVTSPFKKVAAQAVGASLEAINTLVRSNAGFHWANTDVDGAKAILAKLGAAEVTVLGDGGVTTALRLASGQLGTRLRILRRADVGSVPVSGACVWTWPRDVRAPEPLRFVNATVAVVAYGAAARSIAGEIRSRGGQPRLWGAKWFVAQARRQRELWSEA
jgi:hypothetical protein